MREARRFTEFLHARSIKGGSFISKIQAKKIGELCSVRVPNVLAYYDDLININEFQVDTPFVFKATHMSSKQGVFLFYEKRESSYYDLFSNSWLTIAEIKEKLTGLETTGRKNSFIVEEFISNK